MALHEREGSLAVLGVAASSGAVRVLRGGADDFVTPLPFGAIRDLARDASPALERAVSDGSERDLVFELLVEELGRRPLPLAVVVEDVHWADDATLDVLTLLGRRIDRFSALLVLTYRDHEMDAGHPLRPLIGQLPVSAVERIRLEPLSSIRSRLSFRASTPRMFPPHRWQPVLRG